MSKDAPNERRQRRSAYVPHAVRFQLQHILEVLDLEAIVLADDLGFPIARAGNAELAELLAGAAMWTDRHGPTVDDTTEDELRRRFPRFRDYEIASRVIDLPGPSSFFRLTAIGHSCARHTGLEHAERGIRRILDQAARTAAAERAFPIVLAEAS